MAWYIAHDISVTQHGLASYVTKFESQSFRLRSKFGVAFAQQSAVSSQQSAVSSQQSAVSSQQVSGQRSAVSSQQSAVSSHFLELVSKLLCCAYASYFTENKGLLTEQALLVSKESLFRQQAFGPSCANALFLCLLLH